MAKNTKTTIVGFTGGVAYNKTIVNATTGEEEDFSISVCHNMPPEGLIPPLQLWGFYDTSWNEPIAHGIFSFKIPLENLGVKTFPYTMGMRIDTYKSVNNSEDADPDQGPWCAWPRESNFSDQSTWGKVTLRPTQKAVLATTVIDNTTVVVTSYSEETESYVPPAESPGFEISVVFTALATIAAVIVLRRRTKLR